MDINEFYKTNKVDPNFDELAYKLRHPETNGFYEPYASQNGIDDKHRLYFHWRVYVDKNTKEHEEKNAITTNGQKTIYINPLQGLGNRLLQIDSAIAFAKEFSFENVKIFWSSSKGFSDEKFEDLFKTSDLHPVININFIDRDEYIFARKNFTCLDLFFHQNNNLEYEWSCDVSDIYKKAIKSSFSLESFASLDWIFKINLKYRYEFLANYLKPHEKIQKFIDKYKIDNSYVGLHIRAGDALKSNWAIHYNESKLEHYESIVENHDKIFLSTDNEKVQTYFTNKYKNKIVCSKKKFVEETVTEEDAKKYQYYAAIDMFLLSKTRKIFGTNWSTFNKVASKIGSIPIIQLNKETERRFNFSNKKNQYSAITVCKNRFNVLMSSIHSWLLQDDIKEFVIVDYDSEDFDNRLIEKIDDRIKVVTLKNKKYFNLSDGCNVAIQHASYENIIKLDVDYFLNPYYQLSDWANLNLDHVFLTGNWEDKYKDNQLGFIQYLNGFIIVKKKYIEQVKYSGNEYGYGYDDTELHEKLQKIGLKRVKLEFQKNYFPILHIPHKDYYRTQHYEDKNHKESLSKNKMFSKIKNIYGGEISDLKITNPNKSKTNEPFNLIINLHEDKNPMRSHEILYCLTRNASHENIQKIHILGDNIDNYKDLHRIINDNPDLFSVNIGYGRCSYEEIFSYCNQNIKGNCIVANSDVVFSSNLNILQSMKDDRFICLTRHDGGKIITLDSGYYNIFSQDAWIFRSPMRYKLENLPKKLKIGTMFCDSVLNWYLEKSKYKCFNLGQDIILEHFHICTESASNAISNEDRVKLAKEYIKITNCYGWDFVVGLKFSKIQDLNDDEEANKFLTWSQYELGK